MFSKLIEMHLFKSLDYLSGFVKFLILFGKGFFWETVGVIYVFESLNHARPKGAVKQIDD